MATASVARFSPDRYGEIPVRELLEAATEKQQKLAATPRDLSDPSYQFYQKLLQIMRDKQPLTNSQTCPPRSYKPM